MHPSTQNRKEFSHNNFYMWRCVITMAHADGIVHEGERDYLHGIFDNLKNRTRITPEQLKTLHEDVEAPQEPFEMLKQINAPSSRADVIYFARLLAFKDGDLHPSEDVLLKKLHLKITEGLDMQAIREQVRKNVATELTGHAIKKDEGRPDTGLSGLIDDFLLHLDIDLMD